MPKSKNRYIRKENPIKSKCSPWCTMGNNFSRSNWPITQIKRKKCHNGHSWPILKNDLAIPGIDWDNFPRCGKDLQGWDLQITWHPKEGDLRLRSTVHFIFYEGTLFPTPNRRESIYHLSPRNWWSNRKNQHVDQTIPMHIHKPLPIWLGQMAIHHRVHTQPNFLLYDHLFSIPSKLWTTTLTRILPKRQRKEPGSQWICWRNEVHLTNCKVHP